MSKQAGEEKTFRSYSAGDAANYARMRMAYSDALYQSVLSYHTANGGKLDTVVDVGCGPGIATFKLAEFFNTVIGVDPSEAMISQARSTLENAPERAKSTIRFEVSTAENIDPALIPDASVDLITAATCAHWFNMPRFWPTAARILRPGGTVALWCSRTANAHYTVPNADKINAAFEEVEKTDLAPFLEPGNLLARDMYANIGLPWTIEPPEPAFDEGLFSKKSFGTQDTDEAFFDVKAEREFDLDTVERILSTSSPITRWRQAHPEAAGTEDDVVRKMRRKIEKYLHEAGIEKGKERLTGGMHGILLMVKKRA